MAYFTDASRMIVGRAEFEHRYAGAIWRFDNEGNRAAFAADPDVYMPRFGGYDPVGIARGVSTAGYPELWVVFDAAALSLLHRRGRGGPSSPIRRP